MANDSSELVRILDLLVQNKQGESGDGYKGGSSLPPPSMSYAPSNINSGIHLRDYWRAVRKHLGLMFCIVVAVVVVSAMYMARKPDIYTAATRVQVDLENTNPAIAGTKSGAVILAQSNDPAYFNTQLEILTGNSLLRRVVKALDLEHNQSFLYPNSLKASSTWPAMLRMVGIGKREVDANSVSDVRRESFKITPRSISAPEDIEEVNRLAPFVSALQNIVNVKQIRGTRLIEIMCTHSDPELAAKIVNVIADVFVYNNLEKKTQTTSTTADFLQKRVAELQSQIRTGEEQLLNYAKNRQILTLDSSQNTVVDRLTGLNRQLLEAENTRKIAESAYRQSLQPGAADVLAENESKSIAESEKQLADLKQKHAQLLVENTEQWPEVKEVAKQIETLEKQILESHERAKIFVVATLEIKYRQALASEKALSAAFSQQRGETVTQNESAINYRIIEQEIATNKTLLNDLLQRSKENDVMLAGTPNNIHIEDYASVPKIPIGPKRLQAIFVAFVLALAFGIALALLLEYMDDTVRSPEDVETYLRLPSLAVIPSVAGYSRSKFFPFASKTLQLSNGNGNGKASNGNGQSRAELLMNCDSRSALAESYRQLRTSVLLSTAGRPPKTLLVTSSVPGEGKTTTSVNTALSLAQTGAKVLILDADMRRPRIHSIFHVENRHGLSTILSSNLSEAEILSTIEQNSENNIYLLPSGPIPPNPAELLASEQMRRLLAVLECTFDHVVIDSPPIANFTDGALISAMVNGVLLVIHGGKTSRGIVRRSQQMLQEVGAKICGVVMNNVNLRSQDYYYYQKYYHQEYYTPNADTEQSASV